MSTEFVSFGAWDEITKHVKSSPHPVYAAVAFLGRNGSKQLPLNRGSILVVNTRESIVRAGQTCPRELLKLVERGVRVYGLDDLHAKVFVIGRYAYVGSTNVSQRSANRWIESAIRTTDQRTVKAARAFVQGLAKYRLGPERLTALDKIYNPPKIDEPKTSAHSKNSGFVLKAPKVFLAQLERHDREEDIEVLAERGKPRAQKARQHSRGWMLDEFDWTGTDPVGKGDAVLQVTREPDGRRLVDELGTVVHIEGTQNGRLRRCVVFIERPKSKRRSLKAAAAKIGCTQKDLLRNGRVVKQGLARKLLKPW